MSAPSSLNNVAVLCIFFATAVGCQPTVHLESAATDSSITDVKTPDSQTENGDSSSTSKTDAPALDGQPSAPKTKSSLAELLLDPGDIEMVNLAGENTDSKTVDSDLQPAASGGTNGVTPAMSREEVSREEVSREAASTAERTTSDYSDLKGMRVLRGKHITIITDLPSSVAVNELTLVFDRAVDRLRTYFRVAPDLSRKFSMTGFVMQNKERFRAAGLIPKDLPPFLHGYQRGDKFWVYDQPSDYYRRHLVIHEGTHGYMEAMLGGTGAPWYREGIADYLATHLWSEKRLILGHMPANRDEVPYWGRIKLLKEAFADGKALMIQEVMRLETREFRQVDAYAWSWAAIAFLESHPMFRGKFRQLQKNVANNTVRFTRQFEQEVIGQLRELDESWQVFIANIEYGYDFERFTIDRKPGRILPNSGALVSIRADRGWQSTGYRLEAGATYLISASGQCVVQGTPEVWASEPAGITLRYHKGEPLGRLLGNVRLDQARPGLANLVAPIPIGLGRLVQPEGAGTLYLRINDSPAELADNEGEYNIRILPRK